MFPERLLPNGCTSAPLSAQQSRAKVAQRNVMSRAPRIGIRTGALRRSYLAQRAQPRAPSDLLNNQIHGAVVGTTRVRTIPITSRAGDAQAALACLAGHRR